jgi:hypothetical protein
MTLATTATSNVKIPNTKRPTRADGFQRVTAVVDDSANENAANSADPAELAALAVNAA